MSAEPSQPQQEQQKPQEAGVEQQPQDFKSSQQQQQPYGKKPYNNNHNNTHRRKSFTKNGSNYNNRPYHNNNNSTGPYKKNQYNNNASKVVSNYNSNVAMNTQGMMADPSQVYVAQQGAPYMQAYPYPNGYYAYAPAGSIPQQQEEALNSDAQKTFEKEGSEQPEQQAGSDVSQGKEAEHASAQSQAQAQLQQTILERKLQLQQAKQQQQQGASPATSASTTSTSPPPAAASTGSTAPAAAAGTSLSELLKQKALERKKQRDLEKQQSEAKAKAEQESKEQTAEPVQTESTTAAAVPVAAEKAQDVTESSDSEAEEVEEPVKKAEPATETKEQEEAQAEAQPEAQPEAEAPVDASSEKENTEEQAEKEEDKKEGEEESTEKKPLTFAERLKLQRAQKEASAAAAASAVAESEPSKDQEESNENETKEATPVAEEPALAADYVYLKDYRSQLETATPVEKTGAKFLYSLEDLFDISQNVKVSADAKWKAFCEDSLLVEASHLPGNNGAYNKKGGAGYKGGPNGPYNGPGGRNMSNRNMSKDGRSMSKRGGMGDRSGSSRSDSKRRSKKKGGRKDGDYHGSRFDPATNPHGLPPSIRAQQQAHNQNGGASEEAEFKKEENAEPAPVVKLNKTGKGWKPKPKTVVKITTADGTEILPPSEVEKQFKSLLNKLTLEKFDAISSQVVDLMNQSKYPEDNGESVAIVVKFLLAKACDEPYWSSMYAKLFGVCVHQADHELVSPKEENVKKGQFLVVHEILDKVKTQFDEGWVDKLPTNEDGTPLDVEMMSDEYYELAAAKRRGLGLVKLIGFLYESNIVSDAIALQCVKKFLADINSNPQDDTIETLIELLNTIGAKFENAKLGTLTGGIVLDLVFECFQKIIDQEQCSVRIRFKLQDMGDLRLKGWVDEEKLNSGPKTIQAIHEEEQIKKEKQMEERQQQQYRQQSNRGGSMRGNRNNSNYRDNSYNNNNNSSRRSNNNNNSGFGGHSQGSTFTSSYQKTKEEPKEESKPATAANMFSILGEHDD